MAKTRILILGGTTEARQLAERLAGRADLDVSLSLAGRTENPVAHPVPVRVGGFGGVDGLARHLAENSIGLLIDATHPYAAQISRNAAEAAVAASVALLALRRPPWQPGADDHWESAEDAGHAIAMLGSEPRRVFLALGRQELRPFEAAPQHAYLIRSVDPVEPPLAVPDATYILSRGPFREADEVDLFSTHRIDTIIAKNSGGVATHAKLVAARRLGIRVILLERPDLPNVQSVNSVDEALAKVDHFVASAKKRGE